MSDINKSSRTKVVVFFPFDEINLIDQEYNSTIYIIIIIVEFFLIIIESINQRFLYWSYPLLNIKIFNLYIESMVPNIEIRN